MTTTDTGSMSEILLDQANRLFTQHATRDVLSAADKGTWPTALWAALEEAGLPLALVPEESGGVGLELRDAALLVRRSAYYTVPLPLAETILANALWAKAGGEPAAGPVTLAPTNTREILTLTRGADGVQTLSGTASRVPWGGEAGHILVYATDPQGSAHLCLVPAGLATVAAVRNVAYEPRETVTFDHVTLEPGCVLPVGDLSAEGWLAHGAGFRAQQLAGAMERCVDYALTYANERVQFGRPLAKFQAIQHMLAIAAGQLAAATAAADAILEAEGEEFEFAAAVAKARTSEAAGQVAAICHQVHAAMGFTQEHPLHFSTRRLWSWRDEFGSETFWQARIGRLICARGGEALWTTVTGEWAA